MDLINLGKDLIYEHKIVHLLNLLVSLFKSLTQMLIHDDKRSITFNNMIYALLTKHLQSKLMTSDLSVSFGFIV